MNDDIIITTARPEDASLIAELTRAAYKKWVDVIGREPLPMTVDYAEAIKAHRFDLIRQNGDLVALIETIPDGCQLLIVNIAVSPHQQGQGFGSRLLEFAEGLARSDGLEGMRLYTNEKFKENIRLYLAVGYLVDRREPLNGGVAVHMSKRLAPH